MSPSTSSRASRWVASRVEAGSGHRHKQASSDEGRFEVVVDETASSGSVDTPDWVREAVFYQIFPDRFAASVAVPKPGPLEPWDAPPTLHGFKGGDLLGIVEHLDELAELGVNALYLTPIFTSASNHRYHTDDYLSVDPLLGGDEALRELLEAAHERHMRVVLDGVFNHSGRGFLPFHHVVEAGAASPYRAWFRLDQERLAAGRPLIAYPGSAEAAEMDRLRGQGVGAGEASRRVLGYEGWWGLPALPKLDVDNPDTREHLLQVAEHWLRVGIDGWRLDVAEEIDGQFWREFRARMRAIDPEAYIVGEIWHPKPEWLTGEHFDALMDYPLAGAILGFAGGRHLDRGVLAAHHELDGLVQPRDGASFAAELERLMGLYDPAVRAVMLSLLDSHDTPRMKTMLGGDQAAVGLAVVLQMTLPGAPSIFYGDEIGLEGRQDPDCRRSFPWDRSRWDEGLRAFMRDCIWLRRSHRALRDGEFRVLGSSGGAMAYLRSDGREAFVVACNAGEEAAELTVSAPEAVGEPAIEPLGDGGGSRAGAAGASAAWLPATGSGSSLLHINLPARAFAVVRMDAARP
jgi:cyclomaltodextrinase